MGNIEPPSRRAYATQQTYLQHLNGSLVDFSIGSNEVGDQHRTVGTSWFGGDAHGISWRTSWLFTPWTNRGLGTKFSGSSYVIVQWEPITPLRRGHAIGLVLRRCMVPRGGFGEGSNSTDCSSCRIRHIHGRSRVIIHGRACSV